MFSLQGRIKDNKIELNEPLFFDKEAEIIVTFLETTVAETSESISEEPFSESVDGLDFDEDDIDFDDTDETSLEFSDEEGLDFDDIEDDDSDDDGPLFSEEVGGNESVESETETDTDPIIGGDFPEDQYATIRKYKRFKAGGFLNLIVNDKEISYELNDYSSGGLSFLSDQPFEAGKSLTAFIKDPVEQGMSVLEFEIEVVRVIDSDGQYKIGCRFFDEVDEDLWHSLIK